MGVSSVVGVLAVALSASLHAETQSSCRGGARIEGLVTDPTGAIIPGAQVRVANGPGSTTDSSGRYVIPCAPAGRVDLNARAVGFAETTLRVPSPAGQVQQFNIHLNIASVQSEIAVDADSGSDSDSPGGPVALGSREIQQLADDPDDLLRQLQVLASAQGGDPSTTTIRVDGFQNASALPPKSSIASIRVNPDLFSSEYQFPPFGAGQIEITTKPGADGFHGALFFADSAQSFNATDPLSVTATPASKRRYGFEFSGPVIRKRSGFALALEKRDIDEFNVVNAVTLDSAFSPEAVHEAVAAPQQLWIASARVDLQTTANITSTLSFSANHSQLSNEGVGGLNLPEAGYTGVSTEYDLRFSNSHVLNSRTLHETRIGFSWKRARDIPASAAAAVQVAGYFNAGGSTAQNRNRRERDLEIDDDLLRTQGRHEIKIGAQSLGLLVHDFDPDTFNGAYVFGGGLAPVLNANNQPTSASETITPLEQYRRTVLALAGGQSTTYQITAGDPVVPLTQWRLAVYVQDNFRLSERLTVNGGFRYAFQTTPDSFANFGPRVGIAWTPDRKQKWSFHLRAGLFDNSPTASLYASNVARLNGIRQQQATVYSPGLLSPLTPFSGSVEVTSIFQFPRSSLAQNRTFAAYANAEHEFAHQWHVRANLYWGTDYDLVRASNINAPLIPSSVGMAPDPTAALLAPRPVAANENILQYGNTGHLEGQVESFHLDQQSSKRFGLTADYGHMHFKSNVGDDDLSLDTPQSTYSGLGDSSRVDWLASNHVSVTGNLALPGKVKFSEIFYARSGLPFNITTGTDNNGDGDFTDRPGYASLPGPGVYATRYGLMTPDVINGNVPRNRGTMPAVIHLDTDLSRAFVLNPKSKDHLRTLDLEARSANLVNHTNVISVNSVLSSSALGQPLTAETARRLELGARFSF